MNEMEQAHTILELRLNDVETLIDKIRYAMSYEVEKVYVRELLELFDVNSGKLKTIRHYVEQEN